MARFFRSAQTHAPVVNRRGVLSALGAGAALGLVGQQAQAQTAQPTPPTGPVPIEIEARKITTFQRVGSNKTFGRLEFRGGLILTSSNSDFGGLSGLVMEPDGRRFVAISDAGAWISGDLTYQGTTPHAIKEGRIGHIVSQTGRELKRRRDQDAESLALLDGNFARGSLLISFERNHRIGRFPIQDRAVLAPNGYLKMPVDARQMKSNQGFEAVTVIAGGPQKGAIVALSERFPQPVAGAGTNAGSGGQHAGWIWPNIAGEPRRFNFPDIDGFDCTDLASLPDGSLVLLERRFRWLELVQMRLRLFKPGELGPDAVGAGGGVGARGEVLLSADLGSEIDNMEGLGVHRGPKGETVLTLVSDDNFNSLLQRTILLQFALT